MEKFSLRMDQINRLKYQYNVILEEIYNDNPTFLQGADLFLLVKTEFENDFKESFITQFPSDFGL